jgi:chitinase
VRSANDGLYQGGAGPAAGRYESGYQYFRDLPIDERGEATGGFARHWDPKAKAPWLYHASTGVFWSYDDEESLRLKAEYIRFHRLGGLMTWDLNGDSATGDLLAAARHALTTGAAPTADPCRR